MQIGTMKAMGLSNSIIMWHYISLTIALITVGCLIGISIGPFLLPNVMNQKYKLLFNLPSLKYIFPWLEILICYVVFALIGALVSFGICKNEIGKMPADSMRPTTPPSQKHLLSEKFKKINKLEKMPFKMAIRNIKVKKSRSLMVIVGIIGCVALLLCGFGIDDTLNYGIKNDLDDLYYSDISVSYVSIGNYNDLNSIEGIDYYENYLKLPTTLYSTTSIQSNVTIIKDDSEIFGVNFEKNKIAISGKLAEELSVGQGDTISFTILGKTYQNEIDVVYDAFFYHGIVITTEKYNDFANMYNNAWVLTDGNKDNIKENILGFSSVSNCYTYDEYEKKVNDTMSSIQLMTTTLKAFAILLAVVVLYNIAQLNYKERYRDIATLKVLGFNKREIANSLIIEIMILTIVGALVGLLFGLPMVKLVLSINETPVVKFLYHINWISYLYSFAITVGVGFVINIILANMTDKVVMVEALKSYD